MNSSSCLRRAKIHHYCYYSLIDDKAENFLSEIDEINFRNEGTTASILVDFQSYYPGHKDRDETNMMSFHGCFLGFHGSLLWISFLMRALRDLRLLVLHMENQCYQSHRSCHAPEMNVLVEMSWESSLYNWSREVSDKTKKWQLQ